MKHRHKHGSSLKHFPLWVVLLVLIISAQQAFAWPTTGQWIPVYKGGALLQDSNSDASGSRNVVSDATHAAAFIFNDGTYLYYRLRLDASPAGSGGQGNLPSYGWGLDIDTDANSATYEWLLMVDGISSPENVLLWQNTVQGTLGSPADKPEVLSSSVSLTGNFQITAADTSLNNNRDYFLDFRFPYSTFKQVTGLTDSSPIRIFFGTSSSTQDLSIDLVGGTDLYTGFSDYITPLGTRPTTGAAKFAADLAGNGDVTQIIQGDTLYIRVDDADQNYDSTTTQTVTVTLTTQQGDSESITLTETGVNTGIFTRSITTQSAVPVINNAILQIMPGEIVTATYIDKINVNNQQNQSRTDTLQVQPPIIAISKVANPTSASAGATITYTVTITNSGNGDGWVTSIPDTLPSSFTYINSSTSGLTTNNPTINSQILTWAGNWIVPRKTGGINGTLTLVFRGKAGTLGGTFYNNASVNGSNFVTASTRDTAAVIITAPNMVLVKSADKTSARSGEEVIYSIYYRNTGGVQANTLIVVGNIPIHTTYVTGSLKMGGAASTYATATMKTDAAGDDEATCDGATAIFTKTVVSPDDGVPNSGTDEGKVYFKVKIN
jgi:uncharacterized repeat protein (TIGR01451 family)